MKRCLALVWCLGVAVATALNAAERPAPPEMTATNRNEKTVALFNRRDLSGWYSFLEKSAHEDPNGNFKVEDGVLHIEGRDFGYVATKAEFANYRLRVEFKWGTHQYAPRATGKRDSGVLYHFAASEPDKVWPKSIECQVQEGDCGDIWCVGTDVTTDNKTVHEWGMKHVIRTEDCERRHGEWNTIEIVARGDTIEHWVNGRLVNRATAASVQKGKILLQSEGAEVFYRTVELTPLE